MLSPSFLLKLGAFTVLALQSGAGSIVKDAGLSSLYHSDSIVSSTDSRLIEFQKRTRALKEKAVLRGQVNYLQVLESSYGMAWVDQDLLDYKQAWRQRAEGLGAIFVSDYTICDQPATVVYSTNIKDSRDDSMLVAEYEATLNQIELSSAADSSALLHEAGHALQQEAICSARSSLKPPPGVNRLIDQSLRSIKNEPDREKAKVDYLKYLLNQEELEVRLQDLNRFYAVISGQTVMNACDAVLALSALGMEIDVFQLSPWLNGSGLGLLTNQDLAKISSSKPEVSSTLRRAFEDAFELMTIRRLADELVPDLWPKLLQKIALEAPGHL